MSLTAGILIFVAITWVLLILVVWAVCDAAKAGDEHLERYAADRHERAA